VNAVLIDLEKQRVDELEYPYPLWPEKITSSRLAGYGYSRGEFQLEIGFDFPRGIMGTHEGLADEHCVGACFKCGKWGQGAKIDRNPRSPTLRSCQGVSVLNFPVPITT